MLINKALILWVQNEEAKLVLEQTTPDVALSEDGPPIFFAQTKFCAFEIRQDNSVIIVSVFFMFVLN